MKKNMKKIELHVRLDGSLDLAYASELLGRDARAEMVGHGSQSPSDHQEKFALPLKPIANVGPDTQIQLPVGTEPGKRRSNLC